MLIQIVNWAGYNPRADLKHTNWFRIEADIATSRKLFGLDAEQRWFWVYLLSLAASQNKGGQIDAEPRYLAHFSMVTESKCIVALEQIQAAGLITMSGIRPDVSGIRPEMATTDGTNETNGTEHTCPVTEPAAPADPTPGKKARASYRFDDTDMKAARWFQAEVKRGNPMARMVDRANIESWANDIRLLREKHDITWDDLAKVMAFALLDDFWGAVVQSPANVKKNWDKITAKMGRPAPLKNAGGFMGGIQS
jgi:hypothetical protein